MKRKISLFIGLSLIFGGLYGLYRYHRELLRVALFEQKVKIEQSCNQKIESIGIVWPDNIDIPSEYSGEVLPASVEVYDSILIDINDKRTERGLKALVLSSVLSTGAQKRVEDLYQKRQWSHEGFDEAFWISKPLFSKGGEILARQFSSDTQVVNAWEKSPQHSVYMFGDYKFFGIGKMGDYRVVWVAR